MDCIVPAEDTIAVPPADTNGWYPRPSVDPTEARTPPKGIPAVLASVGVDAAAPTKDIVVLPESSVKL